MKMYKGVVVLDVDGVIFRKFFLGKLIQYKSLKNYLKIIKMGFLYYKNKISTERLLKIGYSMASGISAEEARYISKKIRRVKNVVKTIEILKRNGYFISILSAGVPDFILKDLAKELGANHYSGLNMNPDSTDLAKEKIFLISKEKVIEDLIKNLNLKWENVIAIGDDPYNLALFEKSKISIGFNPSKVIRDKATVVIEGNNFLEIIPYILPVSKLPKNLTRKYFNWKKELFRKLIHIFGITIPFLTRIVDKYFIVYLLIGIIIFYLISEILRHHGLSTAIISKITKKAQRAKETRSIIFGPITLGAGIIAVLLLFNYDIYTPSILVVSISDTLSAIIGAKIGKLRLGKFKNSSIEGSLSFFLSAFIILMFFYPIKTSLITALLATIVELVPIYNFDNIAIPLVVGSSLYFLKLFGL